MKALLILWLFIVTKAYSSFAAFPIEFFTVYTLFDLRGTKKYYGSFIRVNGDEIPYNLPKTDIDFDDNDKPYTKMQKIISILSSDDKIDLDLFDKIFKSQLDGLDEITFDDFVNAYKNYINQVIQIKI